MGSVWVALKNQDWIVCVIRTNSLILFISMKKQQTSQHNRNPKIQCQNRTNTANHKYIFPFERDNHPFFRRVEKSLSVTLFASFFFLPNPDIIPTIYVSIINSDGNDETRDGCRCVCACCGRSGKGSGMPEMVCPENKRVLAISPLRCDCFGISSAVSSFLIEAGCRIDCFLRSLWPIHSPKHRRYRLPLPIPLCLFCSVALRRNSHVIYFQNSISQFKCKTRNQFALRCISKSVLYDPKGYQRRPFAIDISMLYMKKKKLAFDFLFVSLANSKYGLHVCHSNGPAIYAPASTLT